jgi:hypothetical protein
MRRRKKIVPPKAPHGDTARVEHAAEPPSQSQTAIHTPSAGPAGRESEIAERNTVLDLDVLPARFHETASHIAELRELVRQLRR